MAPFDIPTELKLKQESNKAKDNWKELFLAALSVAAILVFLILGA